MIKSYQIRIFPTPEQEQLMWKHIGCCRFIWNYMVALQEDRYRAGEKHLRHFDMSNLLPQLKKQEEYTWLNEVSSQSLRRVCEDVSKAYQSFFKKVNKHPKFKSKKRARPSFPLRSGGGVYFKNGFVQVPNIGKVSYKTNYNLPEGSKVKLTDPRVHYRKANGKWILTFGIEHENQVRELSDNDMGIDLGVKELAVVAYGDQQIVFHNINKSKRVRTLEKKKKHLQRVISRKYEVGNRQHPGEKWQKTNAILKYEQQAREIDYKLSNIRKNYIHQTTHKLVELLPKAVVMEDLNVSGMMKNRHLSKAISQQGFFEFMRQMQYKCEWNGIEFVQVPRFYPSSKTCSGCGGVKHDLRLRDRTYICPACGLEIDRDYNAAVNLMKYADAQRSAAA